MANPIAYSRLQMKYTDISGATPTINTATTIDNSWLDTDILHAELFVNVADDKVFTRTNNGMYEFALSPSGSSYNFCDSGIQVTNISGCSPVHIWDSTTEVIEFASSAVTVTPPLLLNRGVQFRTGSTVEMKSINIGDWNMDTGATINVAHGLSATEWKTIYDINVIIRNDTDALYYSLLNPSSALVVGGLRFWDSTNITLERTTAGLFDSTNFDSISYNRGFLTFWYIPD